MRFVSEIHKIINCTYIYHYYKNQTRYVQAKELSSSTAKTEEDTGDCIAQIEALKCARWCFFIFVILFLYDTFTFIYIIFVTLV